MDSRSRFLFGRPSFWEGVSRLIDFGGLLNTYNQMPTADQADQLAMAADFAVVRDELAQAIERLALTDS